MGLRVFAGQGARQIDTTPAAGRLVFERELIRERTVAATVEGRRPRGGRARRRVPRRERSRGRLRKDRGECSGPSNGPPSASIAPWWGSGLNKRGVCQLRGARSRRPVRRGLGPTQGIARSGYSRIRVVSACAGHVTAAAGRPARPPPMRRPGLMLPLPVWAVVR